MSHLPVTKLSYGDSFYRYQWIQYDLGHLACRGKEGYYPSEQKYQVQIDQINKEIGTLENEVKFIISAGALFVNLILS